MIVSFLILPLSAQEGDTVKVMGKVEVIETPESTRVTLGENEVLIVEENGDTVKVVLGSRGVRIVEGENGTEVRMLDMEDEAPSSYKQSTRKKRFRPHFAGLEVGLNNYVTSDFSMALPPEYAYMDLNTGIEALSGPPGGRRIVRHQSSCNTVCLAKRKGAVILRIV